ncbi:MAG: amidohydrolase family protein [Candidatus Promineifilaceae bacterium]|nr:amidohydrolase family protein [Candidatus Promineifilaceae bacterium]
MRQPPVPSPLKSEAAKAHSSRQPVIDVHLHCYAAVRPGMQPDWADRAEARALTAPASVEEHRRATLAEMDRNNVVLGVVSGREAALRAWHQAAPDRFIGGAFLGEDGLPEHSVSSLQRLVAEGIVGVLGELGLQYEGLAPDDPRLAPYYDYLEASGVPLALHTGLGPPGGPHSFAPAFRVRLGRPTLFEPVIAARPHLRAYLMHAGWPYLAETKAMLYIYPKLYVDVGVLAWALTREAFHSTLRELVETGFGNRILFGSDQMLWPGAVTLAIATVERVPFLSKEQKRAILYDNAARFFDLSDKQIAVHRETSAK